MPPPVDITTALESLSTSRSGDKSQVKRDKVAVVVGGTQGIGAALVRRLAEYGTYRRIIILGRNVDKGREALAKVKQIDDGISTDCVKGDLSDVRGTRAAVDGIKAALAGDKIDQLIMTQNGPPTGRIALNEDGDDKSFAIQAISRFTLIYLFITRSFLSPGASIMNICNPGQTYDALTVDDLSLTKVAETRSRTLLCMDQSARDSTVLDSFILEFQERYPQYQYWHLFPGLVQTENWDSSAFPTPIRILFYFGLKVIGQTGDEYAKIPAYILVHPDAKAQLGEINFLDPKFNPKNPGTWASKAENRKALWDKLVAKVDGA